MADSNRILEMYQRFSSYPFGKRLISAFCARQAPYFKTIKPLISDLRKNSCEVLVRKRHAVHNHIGTLHVIAIVNGLEMAMGFMSEASIPKHLRWIPKGMSVDYVGKANSDIRCFASVADGAWQVGDVLVDVVAKDDQDNEVVRGTIKVWVSEKP